MPRGKRQTNIPGTERKVIKEVSEAAEAYREARDQRMALTEDETAAQEKLLAVMEQHGLEVYVDEDASPPFEAKVKKGKTKVKVKVLGSDSGGDEDEE